MEKNTDKPRRTTGQKIMTIIGIVLCVLLLPLLIVNATLIIKGSINPDKLPTFLGYAPLIVDTDLMDANNGFTSGDLLLIREQDTAGLENGTIIVWYAKGNTIDGGITTARISSSTLTEGKRVYIVRGDNPKYSESYYEVYPESICGVYQGSFAGLGNTFIFLKSPLGMLLTIGIPLLLFIGYDLIRSAINKRSQTKQTATSEDAY